MILDERDVFVGDMAALGNDDGGCDGHRGAGIDDGQCPYARGVLEEGERGEATRWGVGGAEVVLIQLIHTVRTDR